MALSKQIQLAHALRRLRRLEQDAAAFRMRSAEISEDHRKPMQRWFQEMVQQQRNTVRKLTSGERRTAA